MKDRPVNIPPEKITLAYHRQYPEISLERYVRSKMLATTNRVLARKIVYLDTRFWILLRDVSLGRPKGSDYPPTLDLLADHIRTRRLDLGLTQTELRTNWI